MRLKDPYRALPNAWRVLMCCFACWAFFCLAQDAVALESEPVSAAPVLVEPEEQDDAQDLGPMTVEIDLDRLLFSTRNNNPQDPVWRLSASPGKRILLLPFTVDNVHRINKLSRFPISVRASRFVGYLIPKPVATHHSAPAVDLSQIVRAAPDKLQQLLFDEKGPAADPGHRRAASLEEGLAKPIPQAVPRLAREITLHPDGTVHWSMGRSFHGAELQAASEQNPYAYKIDPQQLRDAAPQKPERLTRNDGEDSRAFALRKREQQRAEREKQTVYRELRDHLRGLPESFSEPLPSVLYAAIEVPDDGKLTFQGPAPLPWTIDEDKSKRLESLSQGAEVLKGDQAAGHAGSIITMATGHPMDARAVAIATARGQLAAKVQADDPGYELLTRLLQSSDQPTRRIALLGVAQVTPPSLVSAQLIDLAGQASLGEERKILRFASLGRLLSVRAEDPDGARSLMQRVSQTIADPQGPSAPRVIEKVLESLAVRQNTGHVQADDHSVTAMIESIDLSGVEKEELAEVTEIIIQQAPTHPVAAGWLDHQLLGSTDREVVNEALSQLSELTVQITQPTEASGGLAEDEADAAPVWDADTRVITGTIPMTRPDHALVSLFDLSDELQQAGAWAVLDRFHLALPDPLASDMRQGQAQDASLAMFDVILTQAYERDKVPASMVPFIVNQPNPALSKAASDWLVTLLGNPALGEKVSRAALDAYLAEPKRYRPAIMSLDSRAKRRMMEAVYRTIGQEAPLMSGLVADGGETLRWLTAYIDEQGRLPTPNAWVLCAQSLGENTLLAGAGTGDETVAVAAAAALVVRAGGTVQQEQAFAEAVARMKARSTQAVQKQWTQLRSKIFASSFKRSQGTYQFVATLFPGDAHALPAPADPRSERPGGTRLELGLVELRVEGQELSLSVEAITLSPAPEVFGIQIDKPAALRSLDKTELPNISPEHLAKPIILLPKVGGAWSGDTGLPDGRTLRVSLEPAS